MKKNLISRLFLTAFIAGAAGSASAAAPVGADAGHGTLHFTGSVINSPCSIAAGDEHIEVSLGQVANKVLEAGAGYSPTQPVTIHLEDCDLTVVTGTVPGERGESSGTEFTAVSKVDVTFAGGADITNSQLYANTGTAKGVGIRLIDIMGGNKTLNAASGTDSKLTEYPLTPGNNALTFGARLEKTGGAVATGTVDANVTYAMTYK